LPSRRVSTKPLPRPRPLDVAPPRHEAITELADRVATKGLARHVGGTPGNDQPVLAGKKFVTDSAPVETRLHAPVLAEQEELAGHAAFAGHGAFAGQSEGEATGPVRPLADAPWQTATVAARQPSSGIQALPAVRRKPSGPRPLAWPATPALISLLQETASLPPAVAWSADVEAALVELQSLSSVSHPAARGPLTQLRRLAAEGLALAEQQPDHATQQLWLRTAHAVNRRLAAWIPIWQTTLQEPVGEASSGEGSTRLAASRFPVDLERVQDLADRAATACQETGDGPRWESYLLLDPLTAPGLLTDPAGRQLIAQRFLSRLDWAGLQADQAAWLQTPAVPDLAAAVRPWASGPIDYTDLLQQLERQEADALDLAAIEVATATQTLRFAGGEGSRQVAEAIDTHYRNANLRLAVSDALLARLLPTVPTRTEPVREVIMGTPVAGTSHVDSALRLRLHPDEHRWRFDLVTAGNLRATTQGREGPVTVRNANHGEFTTATPITITPEAILLGDATIELQHQSRLRGLSSDFDQIPLIGSLVRSVALAEYRERAPQVQRISGARMERRITMQVEAEVARQIDEASTRLSERLLGPLAQMHLDPTVVDMRTDPQRLIARYRLAGDWQLAAYTPRPRAPSDSWLSLQLHQSALNNTFERLLPAGESRSIRGLAEHLLEIIGRRPEETLAELPRDAFIQFAKTRPVTVEIDEDRLHLTFRVVRLHSEAGLDLRHFIVRATYRPQVEGMEARLVRDGHLSIRGQRMSFRSRIPVRAIFNKVLSDSRPLPLVNPGLAQQPAVAGLAVSQLELRDGWIGLAIGPQSSVLATAALGLRPPPRDPGVQVAGRPEAAAGAAQ